jgi:integrase
MPIDHSFYSVVTTRLDTGEVIPMLVESATWIPARVATRWAIHRRRRSASKTMRNQLFTVKLIYCWAKSKGIDLDQLMLTQGRLSREHLKSLVAELQDIRSKSTRSRVLSLAEKESVPDSSNSNLGRRVAEAHLAVAIDPELGVIENFLSWGLDAINIGFDPNHLQRASSFEQIDVERVKLRASIDAYKVGTVLSRRPEPLTPQGLALISHAINPVEDPRRAPSKASWFPRTPWGEGTCLRNWLMISLALLCGLRIGEILKLQSNDIVSLSPGGPLTVQVLRRPDDPHDRRTNPPAVKTLERVLELPLQIAWGSRLYLTQRPPLGRVAGNSPYLFVTETGEPLSYSSAHAGLKVLGKSIPITNLNWHTLRHTWAESLAKELFALYGTEDHGIEKLRYLGGWSPISNTPFRYIQNAIRDAANDFLRKRNQELYQIPNQPIMKNVVA